MINAEIVAHSLSPQGDELISVLATFPRHILAEVNTHRMLSKNTSSSRAIPFLKMVEAVKTNPFIPIGWQKNHSGMQGSEYHEDPEQGIRFANNTWLRARDNAVTEATMLNQNCDVTKQMANRLLEPFMWTTMLITGSREGWENFFRLRCPSYEFLNANGKFVFKSKKDYVDYVSYGTGEYGTLDWLKINKGAAEIHIMDLAEKIWDARNESTPKQLQPGEWHIPFESKMSDLDIDKVFKAGSGPMNRQEVRVKSSVAMAARTSYTMVGEEKALDYETLLSLHDRLLTQDPPHSSPFEHTARAMHDWEYEQFVKGKGDLSDPDAMSFGFEAKYTGWCYNLKGFIPYRYIVDNSLSL